jgi:hypothetical protein
MISAEIPKSLEGEAAKWFATIPISQVRTFEDIVDKLLHQYKHQTDHPPSLLELTHLEQQPGDSIVAFIDR